MDFIINKDYDKIGDYIINTTKEFIILINDLFENDYLTISELAKNNKIYTDKTDKINNIFNELLYLYKAINITDLLINLNFTKYENDDKYYEYSFKKNLEEAITFRYESYKQRYQSFLTDETDYDINFNIDFSVIYCSWIIGIINKKRDLHMNRFLEFVFPELFRNYNVNKLFDFFYYYDTEIHNIKNNRKPDENSITESDTDSSCNSNYKYFIDDENENDS